MLCLDCETQPQYRSQQDMRKRCSENSAKLHTNRGTSLSVEGFTNANPRSEANLQGSRPAKTTEHACTARHTTLCCGLQAPGLHSDYHTRLGENSEVVHCSVL